HDNLEGLKSLNIQVEYLIAGYALLTVPEQLVEAVAELEEIEYVEKPKRFFYEAFYPADESCIAQVSERDLYLTGKGVLVAVLDSGIDFGQSVFRKADGSTRIRYLWDQTLKPTEQNRPPEGFGMGVEYNSEQIDRALEIPDPQQRYLTLPSIDTSGHGTAVAGIAAGRSAVYRGVAREAELLIVKLGVPDALSFPRTTEIMRGVTWAVNKALALQMPLVINLSFGNSYGAHDGSSLLERFLDNAAEIGRTVICVGTGNEGASGGHLAGNLVEGRDALNNITGSVPSPVADSRNPFPGVSATRAPGPARPAEIQLAVAEYERGLNIQMWKNYCDVYRLRLRSPGGQESELPIYVEGGKYTLQLEQTEILVFMGEPTPYAVAQEIYMELFPVGRPYINSGVWVIRLEPVEIVTGRYYFYLPSLAARSTSTGFYRPTPDVTLTIPATSAKVLTVGAYDSTYDSYAEFSGRGYADPDRTIGVVMSGIAKPDLAAPGVGILAPDLYGGFTPVTGTSFATPIVAGSVALLMEWGIVRGNDPFLYGEKVKAYLRAGARPLRGEDVYPNSRVGWGALCVSSSLPE
ncbi:MAG: S8 family serine peptidase, partial [Acetatifactor sp.]|nr:S8 family serine peptidase [Acetatifactor sp.]